MKHEKNCSIMSEAPLEFECDCAYGEMLRLKQDNAILMEFAKRVSMIYESGSITYMSESEEEYQRDAFELLDDIEGLDR